MQRSRQPGHTDVDALAELVEVGQRPQRVGPRLARHVARAYAPERVQQLARGEQQTLVPRDPEDSPAQLSSNRAAAAVFHQ